MRDGLEKAKAIAYQAHEKAVGCVNAYRGAKHRDNPEFAALQAAVDATGAVWTSLDEALSEHVKGEQE